MSIVGCALQLPRDVRSIDILKHIDESPLSSPFHKGGNCSGGYDEIHNIVDLGEHGIVSEEANGNVANATKMAYEKCKEHRVNPQSVSVVQVQEGDGKMDSRHSFSLLSISGGGRTGRIHVMEGISTKTLWKVMNRWCYDSWRRMGWWDSISLSESATAL